MEDNFTFDEEVDEERFVRKQKLSIQRRSCKAKNFLEQMKKSKYYDEIKLRPSVTNEQKKAMELFPTIQPRTTTNNRKKTKKRNEFVNNKTKKLFFKNNSKVLNLMLEKKLLDIAFQTLTMK